MTKDDNEYVIDPTVGTYHLDGLQAGGGFVRMASRCGGVTCCSTSISAAIGPVDTLHTSSLRGRSMRRMLRRSVQALVGSRVSAGLPAAGWYSRDADATVGA